ncbi:hypothetical protein UK82_23390 [Frankia sp. ACN1ag]|nr:hypothetical protein UK82_23390 [Frankia sp. ACN1ag]
MVLPAGLAPACWPASSGECGVWSRSAAADLPARPVILVFQLPGKRFAGCREDRSSLDTRNTDTKVGWAGVDPLVSARYLLGRP